MELGAGKVLLRLAVHGADMDMPRVTFDTGVDAIAAWTPLSLRTLTERAAVPAEWFAPPGIGPPIVGTATDTGTGAPSAAPPHYRHPPADPVAITHSSGTTRMPAAVVHSHRSLFAAARAVRLTEPRQHGPVRELSAFPQAHTAGVIIMNEALCNGHELLCLSAQGGAFGRSGEGILDAIERWRPTAGAGFAGTRAELARHD